MGSGESDARLIKVNTTGNDPQFKIENNTVTTSNTWDLGTLNTHTCVGFCNHWTTGTYWYGWPTTIYKYQVKCPVRSCKTMNWLELDKITPCTKCKVTLKAVSEQADFEVPITA